MKERVFNMKRFKVRHEMSACKVGVDGVLIGAWAASDGGLEPVRILDAGCGCGLIAMMLAQRFPKSHVIGIDIQPDALSEASANILENGMDKQIEILALNFTELPERSKKSGLLFNLIASNPPFFNSGVNVKDENSPRIMARHTDSLSPIALIENAAKLLASQGRLAIIAPASDEIYLLDSARNHGLTIRRICRVKGNPNVEAKRVMLEFEYNPKEISSVMEESLVIEYSPGDYTPEYRALCKDFYLKF